MSPNCPNKELEDIWTQQSVTHGQLQNMLAAQSKKSLPVSGAKGKVENKVGPQKLKSNTQDFCCCPY